ncbi:MAG: hypothetical protein HKM93_19395 [Desulfobacteraceae bacterium]|nr:hypothetical protein [Desulfobacteraceae bacterium]
MEIVSTTALISINETAFVILISFLIFMVLLNRIMIRPLRQVSEERTLYLKQIKIEIADAEQKIMQFSKDLETKKERVRKEAFDIVRTIEEDAGKNTAEIITEAQKKAAEIRGVTEKNVAGQMQEARTYLENEAKGLTIMIMEKILGRRLTS